MVTVDNEITRDFRENIRNMSVKRRGSLEPLKKKSAKPAYADA
jgi:hypothetical protein